MSSTPELEKINKAIKELHQKDMLDTARASIRVGIHNDVQVTSSNWGRHDVTDPQQTVTQVFSSACAVAYNRGTNAMSWKHFACIVLEASYEATLWAAVMAAVRHRGERFSQGVLDLHWWWSVWELHGLDCMCNPKSLCSLQRLQPGCENCDLFFTDSQLSADLEEEFRGRGVKRLRASS